jgi:hypothetical protein
MNVCVTSINRSMSLLSPGFSDETKRTADEIWCDFHTAAAVLEAGENYRTICCGKSTPLSSSVPSLALIARRRAVRQVYRSLGLPPPAPPWGVLRSKTPEQERGEGEANAQWRWMIFKRSVGSSGGR